MILYQLHICCHLVETCRSNLGWEHVFLTVIVLLFDYLYNAYVSIINNRYRYHYRYCYRYIYLYLYIYLILLAVNTPCTLDAECHSDATCSFGQCQCNEGFTGDGVDVCQGKYLQSNLYILTTHISNKSGLK